MIYEFEIRVQDTRYSDKRKAWYGRSSDLDVKKKFDAKVESIKKANPDIYGIWLLINKLDDDGEFIEVIQ